MCSLEKRIRDLIHFYVKENYNHHLQKNELTFIKEEDGIGDDGNPTDHAIDLAGIRWRNTLGEILYGLKCARFIRDDELGTLEPLGKRRNKKMTKSIEKSFSLIGEHLFSLWD